MLKFNLIPTKKKEDSIIIMKNFFENIYFNNISLFLVLTISLIYICSIFFSYKFNNKDKLSLSTLFLIVFIFSLIFFKIFVLFLIFIPSYIFFYKKDIEYISFRILFLTLLSYCSPSFKIYYPTFKNFWNDSCNNLHNY